MAVILVAGTGVGSGATTVATGIAHRLAYAGHAVRIERLGGDDRAAADAAAFGRLEIADGTGTPVDAGSLPAAPDVLVLEAPAGADAGALASRLQATLVIVGGAGVTAPAGAIAITNHARATAPGALGEDRLLAAPTVRRLTEASRARVLAGAAGDEDAVCEHLVIGAISHDPDEPYFRRYPRPAVIARAEKVDIALAAMRVKPVCLILTGGGEPSPYIIDRVAASHDTTLLLAPEGTVETMRDIEGTFGTVPFAGEAKVERVGELMKIAIDDATLSALLG
jgi:BioD-like phosphotransacetylase family protein